MSRLMKLGSVVCFVLAAFNAWKNHEITLVAIGLAIWVAAEIVGDASK